MSETEEFATLSEKVLTCMTEEERIKKRLTSWPDVKVGKKGEDEDAEIGTTVLPTYANVMHFLDRFSIEIRDDAFRWQYLLKGVPMRDQLDDKAILDFMFAMSLAGLTMGKDRMWDALQAIAHLKTTHELRELFDDLEAVWKKAGEPKYLDTWLHNFAAVDDNAYTRAVSCKPLIAAVRRVRHPGTAFKHMVVIEGPQDIRKSSALRELAMDDYFDDNLEFGASTKEIMEISSGVLIHEVPELSKMSDRQVETVKAMLSRQKDKARMAYGRATTQMPRQFIIYGTSNDRRYLKDATGGVRFWPVWSKATLAKPIDTDGLKEIVRLMWGEAAARERAGESLFLDGEALRLAQVAQGERYAGDANYETLADALEGKEGFIPTAHVLDAAGISDERDRRSKLTMNSITAAMTRLGWEADRHRLVRSGSVGEKVRGWSKGDVPKGALCEWWAWSVNMKALERVVIEMHKPTPGVSYEALRENDDVPEKEVLSIQEATELAAAQATARRLEALAEDRKRAKANAYSPGPPVLH